MTDEAEDVVETGEPVAEPAAEPVKESPPPGDSAEVAAFKAKALDETTKRQTAERLLDEERRKNAANEYDPLDPESVQKLVNSAVDGAVQKVTTAQDEQREQQAWQSKLQAGKEKHKDADLDAIVNDQTLPVTDVMAGIIQRSESGVDLLLHLNANRDVAARIALLPNAESQAMEMGRIAAEIKDSGPQLSNAPDPIDPVGSRSSSDKDPDDMNPREYEAYMIEKRGGSVFPG